MSAFNTQDLKTEINTIINKNEDPMEDANISSSKCSPKDMITKRMDNFNSETESKIQTCDKLLNQSLQLDFIPRPHTLEDFVHNEAMSENCESKSTFTLSDLSTDDEIWFMDIPGTIDPLQLKGQVLQLGDKSKFKIGEDRYCAVNRDSKSNFTCVFSSEKDSNKYQTVNIKPVGTISIRRKLSGLSKKKIEFKQSETVPYPKNVKTRHPFFGVQTDLSLVKKEKK